MDLERQEQAVPAPARDNYSAPAEDGGESYAAEVSTLNGMPNSGRICFVQEPANDKAREENLRDQESGVPFLHERWRTS
jgi:hypothetical protein